MSAPATEANAVPLYTETLGGSLIDAARISTMGALALLPPPAAPLIILPGTEDEMAEEAMNSVHACLEQAMNWLDRARQITIENGAPVTSIHTIGGTPP